MGDGVGGELSVSGNPGPSGGHRRRQGGYAEPAPDGPSGVRGRGFREDGGSGAGDLQGGLERQASHDACADYHTRPAAPQDLYGAVGTVPGQGREPQSLLDLRREEAYFEGLRRRRGGRAHRYARPARSGGESEGPWARDRGRGATLRRQAQRTPQGVQGLRGPAHAHRNPDTTHYADGPGGVAGYTRDRDTSHGSSEHPHARGTLRRGPRPAGRREGGPARGAGLLRAQPRREHRRGRGRVGRARARRTAHSGARPDARAGAGGYDAKVPRPEG